MIKKKDFVDGNFKKKNNLDRKTHPVSMFLKKNINYACKIDEIAKKIKMNKNTVRSMLGKLVSDGLVRHKAPYFAWRK